MTVRILVTGASGYIGRYVSEEITRQGNEVIALSRLGPGESGFRCLSSGRSGSLADHFEGVDHVIHLAGRLVDDPRAGILDFFPANVAFTEKVLRAAVDAGVRSVVHASTRLIYPRTLTEPAVEDRDAAPDTAYGISKAWAEDLVRFASRESGLSALSLRIGQVTGGEHPGLGVINTFIRQAAEGGPITIKGTGAALRDIVHVEDVARGLVAALHYAGSWLPVNLGGTRPVSIREIAHIVSERAPGEVAIRQLSTSREDDSCYALSAARTRQVLDWEPEWSPEAIVKAAFAAKESSA